MNIILNNKKRLVKALLDTTNLGLTSGISGISNEVADVVSGTIANNSYSYNSNYKALRINDTSTSVKGCITIPLGYLVAGDVTNIQCEVFNISGTKVKFAIDYYLSANMEHVQGNIVGTSDIYQSSSSGGFNDENISITSSMNGFAKLVIGVFTSDIGDFYIRNVKITMEKPNHNFERIVKTNRMYTFNGTTLATEFSFDTCTTSIDNKIFKITHDKPFTCLEKRGISIIKTNANDMVGKSLEFRTSSERYNELKVQVYDNNTNDYVDISTALVSGVWFSIVQYGYDYAEDI